MATILISGASRGIGKEMAKQYCEDGDRVYACCRNPGGAEELTALAAESGGQITVHQMDAADAESINACAAELEGVAIDVLINNAGVTGGAHQSLGDLDVDEWIETFKINTVGPALVAQAFRPNLEAADNAKIMTVTSQLGASTWPFGGMYSYSTTKAAVNKVGQILALDLKDAGIASAVIHPGYVKTDMGGPNAEITPEESASGIRSVIDGLNMDSTGGFFKWNGEVHAW